MKVTASGKVLYSEHEIQSSFFSWIELHKTKHPVLNYFFAIPNGAHKSPAARMKFQREGLRRGVPDVCCPIPSHDGQYIGLWFEFKAQGGIVSLDQDQWIKHLQATAHRVEVIRDWTIAADIACEYHGLPLPRMNRPVLSPTTATISE